MLLGQELKFKNKLCNLKLGTFFSALLGMVLGISNKLGFHASRHTFGVLMLNEDIPIGSIARMMGHADITSTQVYAQVTEQKISNDMDKLIAKRERNRLSNEKTIGK